MRKFLSLFAFAFIFIPPAFSQHIPASLKGKVNDTNGNGIAFAYVQFTQLNSYAVTDDNGNYKIENIPTGTHEVKIHSFGFKTQIINLSFLSGEGKEKTFVLEVASENLDEVTVRGERNRTETEKLKLSGFAVNALDTRPLKNTTSDLNQILSRTSGVRVREEGGMGSNFNFSVNGLSGKQVRYFIDGVPMDVFGSSMTLNNIPVNLAERVEVYKGVVPVSLGADAMGGAVNIVTNQVVKNYLDASYSYGSFNSHRAALTGQYKIGNSGLVARANAFYNSSNNNYWMRNVEVWEPESYSYLEGDYRRFHDYYQSFMTRLELGIVGKKWADALYIGGSIGETDQDVQTGFKQDIVYGAVTRNSTGRSAMVNYSLDSILNNRLDVSLFGSLSKDQYTTIDTTMYQYSWDGNRIPRSSGEMGGELTVGHILRPKKFGRVNLNYRVSNNHILNLNYTLDGIRNESYNELQEEEDAIPSKMLKNMVGLAYEGHFLEQRLMTQVFGKFYGLGLEQKVWDSGIREYISREQQINNYGYGVSSRFKLGMNTGIKASYELAYRLQEAEEMFGNGLNYVGNPDLLPENSQNFNLGVYYSKKLQQHDYFFEAGGFIRDAQDFIYAVPYERNNSLRYENKASVMVTGIEGEIRYGYKDLLMASINATYQNAVNHSKYSREGSTIPEATYLNKIPNRPWLFGNTDFSIGKNDLWLKDSRLQFNWNTQYVHWFYLTWEAYGDVRGKSTIPSQFVQNASISYSLEGGRYNFSMECRNFTDALAYDNFMLQKPGRSFAFKIRYFISPNQ